MKWRDHLKRSNRKHHLISLFSRWFICLLSSPVGLVWGFQAGEETVGNSGEVFVSPAYHQQKTSLSQSKAIKKAEESGWYVGKEPQSGKPLSVRGKNLNATAQGGGLQVQSPGPVDARRAIDTLKSMASIFRIENAEREFALWKTQNENNGYTHLRMTQNYRGLRVVGGGMTVHFDDQGNAYQVDGKYVPVDLADVIPAVNADGAIRIAAKALKDLPADLKASAPVLVIWAMGEIPRLAYQAELTASKGRWRVWVDALDGKVLLAYDNLQRIAAPTTSGANAALSGSILSREGGQSVSVTGWRESNGIHYLYNTNRFWFIYNFASSGYGDNNTYAYRNSSAWGTSDRAEMSAARNFDLVQQYFSSRHGRNSFNNSGAYARANIHTPDPDTGNIHYVNAYWDGLDFHIGDGDNTYAYPLAVLDVCAHEFTHAVTENAADLDYYAEPGALNESFSDIFGACVEFYAQTDGRSLYPNIQAGYSDWLMGEDCWIVSKSLRDMRNPRNTGTVGSDGVQPSKYHGTYWYYGSGDNAGVHRNCGPQNFFFYLLCEGGSGNNDGIAYAVTGLGLANAERVAYRALTVYCDAYTDYAGARIAWISAAQDLNASWVASVQAAWAAVGVTSGGGASDAWDPGDNTGAGATVLTPTTTEQQHGPHSLSSTDSYDWFKSYLQAGQSYVFHTQGSVGDNYGELYSDSAGSSRVAYDDDSGSDAQFYITFTPSVSGYYYLRVRGYSVGSSLQYSLKYRQTSGTSPPTDLDEALDASSLNWFLGGDLFWAGQSTTTHDGIDAAQSGAIGDGQTTWFKTTLQGPGLLSFWWRVSSEYWYDFQRFQLDESDVHIRSGEGAWEQKTVIVPAGVHTVRWLYTKDGSVANGSDKAWVDQVVWQFQNPSLIINPTGTNVSCAASGGRRIIVNANVPWTAVAEASWITITGGAAGTTNGAVTYGVTSNVWVMSRTGSIIVAGGGLSRTCMVVQAGAAALLTIKPTSTNMPPVATSGHQIAVTANVPWVATRGNTNDRWIVIVSGTPWTGSGTLTYSVTNNPGPTVRTGSIVVAGGGLSRTCTVVQAAMKLELKPASTNFTSSAWSGRTIAVTANVAWTATSNVAWIAVTAGRSGTNNGTVTFSVATNAGTSSRTGGVVVAGGGLSHTCMVVQAGAAALLAINPTSTNVPPVASSGHQIAVTANVAWMATRGNTNDKWIVIVSGTPWTGNGTLTYSVTNNPGTTARTGSIVVAGGGLGRTCTVVQAGVKLELKPASTNFTSSAWSGRTIAVTANVPWVATRGNTNDKWIVIVSGTPWTGNGTLTYSVTNNPGTTARTGSIVVAGGGLSRTCTVVQAGMKLELKPASTNFTSSAWSGRTIAVTANVAWTATSNAAWIAVTAGRSGTNNGTVTFSVATNTGTSSRTGGIVVAGGGLSRTCTVVQTGTAALLTIKPPSTNVAPVATSGHQIAVTANVPWVATRGNTNDKWIVIVSGTPWTGSGTLTYSVTNNPGTTARTGSIVVAGGGLAQTCTVVQAGVVLEINPTSTNVAPVATSGHQIAVSANVPWVATRGNTNDRWIVIVSGTPWTGSGTLTYSVTNNPGTTARAGSIVVAGGGLSRTCTVVQTGNSPGVHRKVNCGGVAINSWETDTGWTFSAGGGAATVTVAIANAGNVPQAVYQTRRYGGTLTYDLAIPDGTYYVRLHFAELYWTAAGKRSFNVAIEGRTVLTNFDIWTAAGGINRAVTRTFEKVTVSGGLQIQGVASVSTVQFNGIEVWSDSIAGGAISECWFAPAQRQVTLLFRDEIGGQDKVWWTTNLLEWPTGQVISLSANQTWSETNTIQFHRKFYRLSK